MHVLIADKLPPEARVAMTRLGFTVDFRPELAAEELPGALGEAHVLVVRSTRVTEAALAAGPRLQLVVRAGAGTNTIDGAAAAARGIYVCNCPGKNAIAVAELTWGLILALDRRIPDNVSELRAGRWNKKRFGAARGLYGRTLGIVGLGTIGIEVARRARGFGMRVVAWSRSLTAERAEELGVARAETVLDLCARSDVVSVHVAFTPATRHLLGAAELAAMRPGALLVNAARGGIVDEAALTAALAEGRIRAASDVFEGEPSASVADWSSGLAGAEGFYGTHHIGASTDQAQQAIAAEVVEILGHWQRVGEPRNAVNVAEHPPAAGLLLVRHLDRVGVLAAVLDVLQAAGTNVEDMANTIFDGGQGACARLRVSAGPDDALLARLRASSPHVLAVEWLPEVDPPTG